MIPRHIFKKVHILPIDTSTEKENPNSKKKDPMAKDNPG